MSENQMIFAEVILKSHSGQSLATSDTLVTSENIEAFDPPTETVTDARKILNELGFNTPQTGITVTISGPKSTFEKVFQCEIIEKVCFVA